MFSHDRSEVGSALAYRSYKLRDVSVSPGGLVLHIRYESDRHCANQSRRTSTDGPVVAEARAEIAAFPALG
jgi:hypothetical protein